ncbi:MAG TPA: PAS domain S-box protein [Candidatus Hydrogenedentes bacterium]|nr:PAS domain S-box protein [Candidatus Hydrogenedentota bacterium]
MLGSVSERRQDTQQRLTYFVVPVLIGLGGIVFSQQLPQPATRYGVLFVSCALPLFAAGNLLARFNTSRFERLIILTGVLMIMVGAAATLTGWRVTQPEELEGFGDLTYWARVTGVVSLLLGLFVVLFNMVRAGADVEEMTQRFLQLAELIQDGFIMSSPEGRILLVNRRLLGMIGLERDQVEGRHVLDLIQALRIPDVDRHWEERARGVATEYQVTLVRDGVERVLLFNGAPVFDRAGRHSATIAIVRDITEQVNLTRRVEQYARGLQQLVEEKTRQLSESEERLRALLFTMNEGFLTLDTAHTIQFANAQLAGLLGRDPGDLEGIHFLSLVEPANRNRVLGMLAASARNPSEGARGEINLLDSEDNPVPVLAAVSALVEHDAVRGYSIVVTDLSEIRQMQNELAIRARDLERANEELRVHGRAKDLFLSSVSHELRTPLSTIQGYLELLQGGELGPLTDAQRDATRTMSRNAERLLGLINQMLEFSRIQIRGIQLVYSLVDPVAVAREGLAAIEPAAREKGLTVELDAYAAPRMAWLDREKIAQALGILLHNAVKFTQHGGITVLVHDLPERGLLFAVRDTGIGIDPAFHDRIFEKFFQVDSSKARQYEGTGLGLSIAKTIVEAHEGKISVESAPGMGSTFLVALPGVVPTPAGTLQDAQSPLLSSTRVLLVSDFPDTRDALECLCGECFGSVTWSRRAHHAAREALAAAYDLIFIDEAQGDVLGEQTLRVLRAQEALADIPVLVWTMETGEARREAALRWTGSAYLLKPFLPAELLETAAGLLMPGMPSPVPQAVDTGDRSGFVVVIDRDPGILEWLEMALRRKKVGCHCVTSARDAMEALRTIRPDAVFLDGDTADVDPEGMISTLRATPGMESVPLYLMTGSNVSPALAEKVQGVLVKPFSLEEVLQRLEPADRADHG